MTAQIRPFLPVQFQLCIRQSLHREPSAKEAHAQRAQRTRNLRSKRNRRRTHPEWKRERQRDKRQESSLWKEKLEGSRVPEARRALLLLELVVPRVILPARDGPRHDAVEESCTPQRHGAQKQLLGPGEDIPGGREGEMVVVHAAADGAPPGIGDLAGGPVVVFEFAAVGGSRGGVTGEG